MSGQNETFNYTYSAEQQEEVEAIRKKYTEDETPTEADKMEQLRRLDASVTNKATVWSLCVGIVFALVMGFGMSLVMTDLGVKLGITSYLILGIVIGIVGMLGVIAAYPLYQFVLKRERKKKAPQILKLAEELSQK